MKDETLLQTLLAGVVAAWLLAGVGIYFALGSWGNRGQFGDLFGSVNSLFSGLAFAALFFTLRLQQKQLVKQEEQLSLQQQELALQREEMAASRAELAKQAAALSNLTRATIAQIRVAAVNAQIEAYKIKADTVSPTGRSDQICGIENAADVLRQLAEGLESESET